MFFFFNCNTHSSRRQRRRYKLLFYADTIAFVLQKLLAESIPFIWLHAYRDCIHFHWISWRRIFFSHRLVLVSKFRLFALRAKSLNIQYSNPYIIYNAICLSAFHSAKTHTFSDFALRLSLLRSLYNIPNVRVLFYKFFMPMRLSGFILQHYERQFHPHFSSLFAL